MYILATANGTTALPLSWINRNRSDILLHIIFRS